MNKTELVSAMAERLGASKKHSEEALTVALDHRGIGRGGKGSAGGLWLL